MKSYHWEQETGPENEILAQLQQTTKLRPEVLILLWQRGLRNEECIRAFLNPSSEQLHPPLLMKDMDKAMLRLEAAYHSGEKMMILGDYDVDGITSVAIVYQYLSHFFSQVTYYIPDRNTEGYGISIQSIDFAKEAGISLIIALDCGIKSMKEVEYARDLGIDFIIGDHHLPDDKLPNAVAILNPKQENCHYPFKDLPGCGIGFKLCQAWASRHSGSKNLPDDYLDLVAVGIAADIVPLIGENRVLARLGLNKLAQQPGVGLQALLSLFIEKKSYKVSDVVFSLGPRINAAGRIGHGHESLKLLLETDRANATKLAAEINQRNKERQKIDQLMTREAIEMVDAFTFEHDSDICIVFHPSWHKGVLGIVASRLVEKYHKPAIVLCSHEGLATGSARSIPGFDLHAALRSCDDLLVQYGGHPYAAGLTLQVANLPSLQVRLNEIAREKMNGFSSLPTLKYCMSLPLLSAFHPQLIDQMKRLEPYGPLNMTPLFLTTHVWDAGTGRVVGNNHLSLMLMQDGIKRPVHAIGFKMGAWLSEIQKGRKFDIIYSVHDHEFNKESHLQVNIRDLRLSD